ncbi:hypothetical protein J6590_107220 [Homalodisca vitripennis]|nr:hypothetical protein J6590_107220 [Homalodisca vitripennis]
MGEFIDNDVLISLVQARPVLWDKTLASFKDRNLTRDAWREVCCALKDDFEAMEEKEKNAFGKEVIKRWGNIRDAFSKSKEKLAEFAESLEVRTDNNEDKADNNLPEAQLPPKKPTFTEPKPRENKRRRQPDEAELKMIKALEEQSPHIFVIQGLLPHLHNVNNSFQSQQPHNHPKSINPQIHQFHENRNQSPQNPSKSDSNHQLEHQQQTTAQYYQDFGHTSATTSPENYPSASLSPAESPYSEASYDFN